MEFYICKKCGKMVGIVKDSAVPLMCCGEKMTKLVAGSTDAAVEKHVPVIANENGKVTVTVGSVAHPMTAEHSIEWIAIETAQGAQRKPLKAGDAPKAEFALTADDTLKAAYAYCNLHGLWMAKA